MPLKGAHDEDQHLVSCGEVAAGRRSADPNDRCILRLLETSPVRNSIILDAESSEQALVRFGDRLEMRNSEARVI
jgi:hypothetical protein